MTEIQGAWGGECPRHPGDDCEGRAPAAGLFATVLNLMILLIGGHRGGQRAQDTRNTMHVQPAPASGLLSAQSAPMALAFVLGIGFLLLVSLVVSAVLSA